MDINCCCGCWLLNIGRSFNHTTHIHTYTHTYIIIRICTHDDIHKLIRTHTSATLSLSLSPFLICSPFLSSVLSSVLPPVQSSFPPHRHLEPDEAELFNLVAKHCKKTPMARRREHLAYLRRPLVQVQNDIERMRNESRLTLP